MNSANSELPSSHSSARVERARVAMADSVTQLQNQINTLCQLMFNYAGTLQRDAKPVRRPTRSTARKMRDAARELSPVRHD